MSILLVAPNFHAKTTWAKNLMPLTSTVAKLTKIDEPSMSIFTKNVPRVNLAHHISKFIHHAVGDYDIGLGLEMIQVRNDPAIAKFNLLIGGLIHNNLEALGFDAVHYALNAAASKAVSARSHGESVYAHGAWALRM